MATINLRTPNGYNGQLGTQHKFGIVRFATEAEAEAQTSTSAALSPATAALAIPDASTTVKGIVELATNAEAVTGTDTERAIVPSSLTARLAAPGAIGGTTPGAGTFTNVTVNDIFAIDGGAATDNIGQTTLVAGVATVLNTSITANDKVFCQRRGAGASTALGLFDVAVNAATSFVITAKKPADATTETGDISVVDYIIVRQV